MNIQVPAPAPSSPIGLDGVPAAVTALSHVDGQRGELIIAGRQVDDLAGDTDFESVARRLWAIAGAVGEAPALGPLRVRAFDRALAVGPVLKDMNPIDALRAGIAALEIGDGPEAAAALTAAVPVMSLTLLALSEGRVPVAPDARVGHAADILRMMRDDVPSAAEAAALEAYLTTVSDHGMNASTFACRVVIATRASLVSAVTAAYGALTGPLHGGAPGPVLDMLDAIGTEANISQWLDAALEDGERLMGFGHRIYRTRDPRADVLKAALAKLAPNSSRLDFALKVERAAHAKLAAKHAGRKLDTNVEFYTALLLDALKIPRHLFTPVFAMGRVAGWTAHAIEHHARKGRLIRPDAVYDGAMP
jgi:citrate synthase